MATVKYIPIFIINLKKDVEKKKYMQNLCAQYNLHVEFINAIYGKELNQQEIASFYLPMESKKIIGRELAKSEIGCALSHKIIYEKIVNEKIPYAVILEDDIIFDDKLRQFLIICKTELTNIGWDCILLNYYIDNALNKHYCLRYDGRLSIGSNYTLVRFAKHMHSTAAYLISFSGAVKILNALQGGISKPIDLYTGDSSLLNLYGLIPKVVEINQKFLLQSNIQKERDLMNKEEQVVHNKKYAIKIFLKKLGIMGFIYRIYLIKYKISDQYIDCFIKKLSFIILLLVKRK